MVSGGGIAVGSASEILKELSIKDYELRQDRKKLDWNKFSEDEKKILMTLENEELAIDEIRRRAKISIGMLMVCLTDLELGSIVKNSDGKWSIRD